MSVLVCDCRECPADAGCQIKPAPPFFRLVIGKAAAVLAAWIKKAVRVS
jgi:hypothetical protein